MRQRHFVRLIGVSDGLQKEEQKRKRCSLLSPVLLLLPSTFCLLLPHLARCILRGITATINVMQLQRKQEEVEEEERRDIYVSCRRCHRHQNG
ncbi:hypothetical protein Trydic_g5601 [Trypoxylus dichotomus]